jgi:alpha-mannosidase
MRLAQEHQNPFITGKVTGGSAYPPGQFSLLTISNANVLLSALKPAEAGIASGIVARVWNLSNSPLSCTLSLSGNAIASAQRLTHVERPLAPLPVAGGAVSDSLAAQQLKTYALIPNSLTVQGSNQAAGQLSKK